MGKIFGALAGLTAAIGFSTTNLNTVQAQHIRPVINAVRLNIDRGLEKKEPTLDDVKKQIEEIYKGEIIGDGVTIEKDGVKLYKFKIMIDGKDFTILFIDKDKSVKILGESSRDDEENFIKKHSK